MEFTLVGEVTKEDGNYVSVSITLLFHITNVSTFSCFKKKRFKFSFFKKKI